MIVQMMTKSIWLVASFIWALVPPAFAEGGFALGATRIVMNEANRYGSVKVMNHSSQPLLIQSKVLPFYDKTKTAPFAVTPPVFRLEPHSDSIQRIVFLGGQLPSDRESVFTFVAVSAAPSSRPNSTTGGAVTARVPVSIGTAIKLFWRPTGLKTSQRQGMSGLQFGVQGPESLRVINASPYNVTLLSLNVGEGKGQSVKFTASQDKPLRMLPPWSHYDYSLHVRPGMQVRWAAIDDLGGVEHFSGRVKQQVQLTQSQ